MADPATIPEQDVNQDGPSRAVGDPAAPAGAESQQESHGGADHAASQESGDDHGHAGDAHAVTDPMDHYLEPGHLIHHVQDTYYFEFPSVSFGPVNTEPGKNGPLGLQATETFKINIPFGLNEAEHHPVIDVPDNNYVSPLYLRPTKFMVLEVIAAILIFVLFTYLARHIKNGDRPQGRLANLLESLVLFVRDDIGRPSIGSQDANRFLPFLWTVFFFVLTLNLMGMIPFMGTATGALGCTVALAGITFAIVLGAGMKRLGVLGFWKAQAPHVDVPFLMKVTLVPIIWAIEVFGLFIKHMVLAVRLFANMFAGHLVLAVFVGFIGVTWGTWFAAGVLPASIGASVMISLLELLVALIQAYVFAFLSALFIGAALHPH